MTVTRNEHGTAAATWVDPQTGLEWQFDSPGRMSWHDAQTYARELSLNDKGDWRIPAVSELESLLDRSKYRPVMRELHALFQEQLKRFPSKSSTWRISDAVRCFHSHACYSRIQIEGLDIMRERTAGDA